MKKAKRLALVPVEQPPTKAEPSDEPSSPALPTVRPALASKVDPFSASSSSSSPAQQQAKSTAPKKSKSSKMQIFADGDDSDRPSSGAGASPGGWDNIGTIAERKKENTHAAKPMAGEKLKVGKTNGGMQKMMVFKDAVSQRP